MNQCFHFGRRESEGSRREHYPSPSGTGKTTGSRTDSGPIRHPIVLVDLVGPFGALFDYAGGFDRGGLNHRRFEMNQVAFRKYK